jgi:hypothetical protein
MAKELDWFIIPLRKKKKKIVQKIKKMTSPQNTALLPHASDDLAQQGTIQEDLPVVQNGASLLHHVR